jgi:hypothetical protein
MHVREVWRRTGPARTVEVEHAERVEDRGQQQGVAGVVKRRRDGQGSSARRKQQLQLLRKAEEEGLGTEEEVGRRLGGRTTA